MEALKRDDVYAITGGSKEGNSRMRKVFKSHGIVYGNFWGGGEGTYPARKNEAATLKELIKINEAELKTGGLDSGMGYQSLIGAMLYIQVCRYKDIGGRLFENEEYLDEPIFIGTLTDKQKEFCINVEEGM